MTLQSTFPYLRHTWHRCFTASGCAHVLAGHGASSNTLPPGRLIRFSLLLQSLRLSVTSARFHQARHPSRRDILRRYARESLCAKKSTKTRNLVETSRLLGKTG